MPETLLATTEYGGSITAVVGRWKTTKTYGMLDLSISVVTGKPFLFAVISGAIPKARSSNARRAVPADDLPIGVLSDQVVDEHVLGDDGVAFHTHHLSDVGDAPGAVAQTSSLNDDVDRSADHLANGPRRQ